jgi:hypothetical protein
MANAPEAMNALAGLRGLASAPPAPVAVSVGPESTDDSELASYVEEARQALRLSGTEFVLAIPDIHRKVDVQWTVKKLHAGAATLESVMPDFGLTQEFYLSFTASPGDLTNRVVSLMHSRMHRIRYIWPYQDAAPTVVRDVDLTLPVDGRVKVQRVTWRDPDRNDFVPGEPFWTTVTAADAFKFIFNLQDFRTAETGATDFQNPLSNVGYRVLLARQSPESTRSKALTATFLGLLLFIAIGGGIDIRRRLNPSKPDAPRTLPEVCAKLAAKCHDAWRGKRLKDADLLSCERPRLEQHIEELKTKGAVPAAIGGVTRLAYQVTAGIPLPFVGKVVSAQGSRQVDLVVDPARVGDTVRLDALLDLMIRNHLLSSFVGRPLEWAALNELARRILPGAEQGEEIIRAHDKTVVAIASRNFNQVLDDALNRLSLFHGTWTVTTVDGRRMARQQVDLPGPLLIGNAQEPVTALVLEFNVPDNATALIDPHFAMLDCWLLGRIVRLTHSDEHPSGALCLHFRTFALLHGDVSVGRPAGARNAVAVQ